jgi:hypothetical protein
MRLKVMHCKTQVGNWRTVPMTRLFDKYLYSKELLYDGQSNTRSLLNEMLLTDLTYSLYGVEPFLRS